MELTVIQALSQTLGTPVHLQDRRPLSGGCINDAAVFVTDQGSFFVKWNHHPIPDQFEREAEALEEMRASNTSLRIPRPICERRPDERSPAFLVLEYIEPGRRVTHFDELLGRGLAELHRKSAERFGFHHDNYCGATPQPNPWEDDWLVFYRELRLRHQLRLAVDQRGVSRADRQAFEALLDRLDEILAADPEPPALIHGDLWSGNLHVAPEGTPALIDPAAYYAHREAELGMMMLFGGFSSRVYDAYHEHWPLQDGWRERVELYSLYHVLNHYNLFGGGYGAQAFSIVRRWI